MQDFPKKNQCADSCSPLEVCVCNCRDAAICLDFVIPYYFAVLPTARERLVAHRRYLTACK